MEYQRTRTLKRESLKAQLDTYVQQINRLPLGEASIPRMNLVEGMFPPALRITLIDKRGHVLYDNQIPGVETLENHLNRREVKDARSRETGTDIRKSESDGREYLYFARQMSGNFIRVALPYDVYTQTLLQPDKTFTIAIAFLLLIMLVVLYRISDHLGIAIRRLRDFAKAPNRTLPHFPDDELGEITYEIARHYEEVRNQSIALRSEKEKLLQHILYSQEGICFFSPQKEVEYFNGLFVQYLNTISDRSYLHPQGVWHDPLLEEWVREMEQSREQSDYYENKVYKQGRVFLVRIQLFDDGAYEWVINDISEEESNNRLKQEITENIAHELRTPITSIRAYLETLLHTPMDDETRHHFLEQAYLKSVSLSDLIRDMNLLSRMKNRDEFPIEEVEIAEFGTLLEKEFVDRFRSSQSSWQWQIDPGVVVRGNRTLLYSIFRNLVENALAYAGEQVEIGAKMFQEDLTSYTFSFYDTGVGVPQEHLTRLFERFYRVDSGRTRDSGGTGLGLSIVRNAILFHRGDIVAKNRIGGGLELIFRIAK